MPLDSAVLSCTHFFVQPGMPLNERIIFIHVRSSVLVRKPTTLKGPLKITYANKPSSVTFLRCC